MNFLTDDWCRRLTELSSDGSGDISDATFDLQVSGAPGGVRKLTMTTLGGRVASCAAGKAGGEDTVVLKVGWDDAVAILRGELDANAAFMTGQIKTDGPTGPLLSLLSSLQQPPAQVAREQLLAETSLD